MTDARQTEDSENAEPDPETRRFLAQLSTPAAPGVRPSLADVQAALGIDALAAQIAQPDRR